jgi:hypothetical protein
MDHFFAVSESEPSPFCLQPGSQWSLAVDLFDAGDEYLVAIDLPGVEKEKLNLSVTVDKIVIKGRREEGFMVPGSAEVIVEARYWHQETQDWLPFDPSKPQQYLEGDTINTQTGGWSRSQPVALEGHTPAYRFNGKRHD